MGENDAKPSSLLVAAMQSSAVFQQTRGSQTSRNESHLHFFSDNCVPITMGSCASSPSDVASRTAHSSVEQDGSEEAALIYEGRMITLSKVTVAYTSISHS